MIWKNGNKKFVEDFDKQLLHSLVKDNLEKKIIIGCDSQLIGNSISFVSTVVVWSVGHGAVFFYTKQIIDFNSKYSLIQNRLFEQTYRAVQVAKQVDDILSNTKYSVSEIHCDLNDDKKFRSNKAVAMCVGYINGNGYKAIIKPESFAASSVADSLTR